MESERDDKDADSQALPVEVDVAFARLPVEARTALWLALVEGARITEVAESIGTTEAEASLLVENGVAEVMDRLRRRGWRAIRAGRLAALLAAAPAPEPPMGLQGRILKRFERYFL